MVHPLELPELTRRGRRGCAAQYLLWTNGNWREINREAVQGWCRWQPNSATLSILNPYSILASLLMYRWLWGGGGAEWCHQIQPGQGRGLNKIDFVQDRLLRLHIHSIYIFRWNILIARIMLKSVLKRQNIFVIYNVYSNWQSGIVRKYIEPRKKSGENLNWKCAVRQPCQQMTGG